MTSIVSFFGADHKCGTGMISQCIAERIAYVAPNLKILLIHCNGRDGTDYSPTANESMDNIRPYMADQLIDGTEIFAKSHWKDNLHVIAGAKELGSASMYNPEMAGLMLKKLQNEFDLIICDSGSEIEHGLSLGSLISATSLYIVLTQSECAIRHYEWQKKLLDKLQIRANAYIINKFEKSSPYNVRYIKDRLMFESNEVFAVRLSEYGVRAEYDERSLVNYPGSGFKKDIDSIAVKILEDTGLRMTPPR